MLPVLDAERLVFVDETAAYVSMNRRYGWSKVGEPAIIIDNPHGKRLSIIGAIAADGVRAQMTFEGTLNGDRMLHYVHNHLGPALRTGDIVVLDGLSVHRMKAVRAAIQGFGASVLFLPPYSPELNPIEHTWSTLKARLRRMWTDNIDDLRRQIEEVWPAMTPFCAGWVTHCGYIASN